MFTPTVAIAIITDLVAATILAVGLYYRRHRRRDLMFAFLALNVGVLAVATALGTAQASVGMGLGLFGVLSIIRLRSDPISQAEVAYYFCALALGLIGGLAPMAWWVTPVFAALLLAVVAVADHPSLSRGVRTMNLTLDVAVLDEAQLEKIVGRTVGGRVTRLNVQQVDLVRDLTVLDVWFEPLPAVPSVRPGQAPVTLTATGEPAAAVAAGAVAAGAREPIGAATSHRGSAYADSESGSHNGHRAPAMAGPMATGRS